MIFLSALGMQFFFLSLVFSLDPTGFAELQNFEYIHISLWEL